MSTERRGNIKWLEGARGLASVIVVTTHLCRAWDYSLWWPRPGENEHPRLLQLPFLRIPWQGRIGVTMFAFITGYVCALKPLRLARAGHHSAALTTVAKSAFRRTPRLVLPATFAMFCAWLLAQLNGFKVSNRCDSEWLRFSSPELFGLDVEVPRLFHNLQTVWVNGRMEYDDHQWALLSLLKGAFTVYVTLCATIFMKFQYRIGCYFLMWLFFWLNPEVDTETFPCQMFFGMILCDIGNHPAWNDLVASYPKTRRFFEIYFMILGLYVAGAPGEHPEWALWSQQLEDFATKYFPEPTNHGKRWSAVGWHLIATAIWLSPKMQAILSNSVFSWIGKHSFGVYLTHGTILRVVLARMIYGWSGEPFTPEFDDEGRIVNNPWLQRAGPLVFLFSIPIFFVMVYGVAYIWINYVDAFCSRLTLWAEQKTFEESEKNYGANGNGTLPK